MKFNFSNDFMPLEVSPSQRAGIGNEGKIFKGSALRADPFFRRLNFFLSYQGIDGIVR